MYNQEIHSVFAVFVKKKQEKGWNELEVLRPEKLNKTGPNTECQSCPSYFFHYLNEITQKTMSIELSH